MTPMQRTYTYTDPRYIDGDPFEVARAAVEQAGKLTGLAAKAVEDANVMARNAEMERRLYRDEDPNAEGWPDTAHGRQFAWTHEELAKASRRLRVLRDAVSFNPRHPPKA